MTPTSQLQKDKKFNVSDLYIPKEKRVLKSKVKNQGFLRATLPQEDRHVQFSFDLLADQLGEMSELEGVQRRTLKKRPKLRRVEEKRRVPKRRKSFTDEFIKYKDLVHQLKNPLKTNQHYTIGQ